jgi:hypothetical protein
MNSEETPDDLLKKMEKANKARANKAKAKGSATEETKQGSDTIDKKNRLTKEE